MAAITSQLDVAYNLSNLCRQVLSSADVGRPQYSQAIQPANQSCQDQVVTQGQRHGGKARRVQQQDSFLTEVPAEPRSLNASNTTPRQGGNLPVAAPVGGSSYQKAVAHEGAVARQESRTKTSPEPTPAGRGGAQTSPRHVTTTGGSRAAPRRHQPGGAPMRQRISSGSEHAPGTDTGGEFPKGRDLHEGDTENGAGGGGHLGGELESASSLSRGQVKGQDFPVEEETLIVAEDVPSSWSSMVSLGQDGHGEKPLQEEEAAVPPEEIPSSWSSIISEEHHGRAGVEHPPTSAIPEESSTWSGYISEFQPATPPETTLTGVSVESGDLGVDDPTGENGASHTRSMVAAAGTFRDNETARGQISGATVRETVNNSSAERRGRTAVKPTTPRKDKDGEPQSYHGMGRGRSERGGQGLSGGEVCATNNASEGAFDGRERHGGLALDSENERESLALGTTLLSAENGTGLRNDTDGRRSNPIAGVDGGSEEHADSVRGLHDVIPLEIRPPSGALAPVPEPDAEAKDPYGDGEWEDVGDDAEDDGNWSSWLAGGGGG